MSILRSRSIAEDIGERDHIRLVDQARSNHPVEYLPIAKLKDPARKTRTPSDTQIEQLAVGIGIFGFNSVVVVDGDDRIVCGYARVQAAKKAGMISVPVMRITHLSKAMLKAFRIFDNKISESAGWDAEQLALEFEEILQIHPDFTLELTGFSLPEIDIILNPETNVDAADEDGIEPNTIAVSRVGDLWLIAGHKLLNADAKLPKSYELLLGVERPRQVVSDFPYNVRITNNVSGLGAVKHREFVEASGEFSDPEFLEFLVSALMAMTGPLSAGAILHIFMDWRSSHLLVQAALRVGLEFLNICVWDKGSGGMGSLYRSRHEFVLVFKKPGGKHTNNIQLGKNGRYRTNVWEVPGLNRFSRERQELLSLHATVKPVTLIAEAIKDCSNRGEIILDPFCGSGTTLIAAELTGRVARCMDLDSAYCDVAIRRFEKRFGIEAVHSVTGRTFAEEAEARAAEAAEPAPQAPLRRRRPPPA
ncbi:MAG: DNA methylase N-4 [Mesorhizobium sp.]|nr:DNA methyltransferase [Mesorhizobium sp.]MBL8575599.1 DNA methylase N-4 [Mesorhizobium sp.]